MQNETYKPKRVTDRFIQKKQLCNGYKVVEFFHYELHGKAVSEIRKRIVAKNLTLSDAEAMIFSLERK